MAASRSESSRGEDPGIEKKTILLLLLLLIIILLLLLLIIIILVIAGFLGLPAARGDSTPEKSESAWVEVTACEVLTSWVGRTIRLLAILPLYHYPCVTAITHVSRQCGCPCL